MTRKYVEESRICSVNCTRFNVRRIFRVIRNGVFLNRCCVRIKKIKDSKEFSNKIRFWTKRKKICKGQSTCQNEYYQKIHRYQLDILIVVTINAFESSVFLT